MKKFITLFTLAILSSLSLTAQSKATKKADKHFARFEFVEAAEEYAQIANKGDGNTYIYSRLAESYYNTFNTTEAEKWYAKALAGSTDSEMMYRYAQMLKANGNYSDAKKWMAKFAANKPSDLRAKAFKDNPDHVEKILNKDKKFTTINADFNTQYSEFGGTVNGKELFFASARNTSRKTYGWNEQPFLDMYALTLNDDGNYSTAYILEGDANTKYHEGLTTFSPDGNIMYFSRESYFEDQYEQDTLSKNKISVIQLYKAGRDGVNWTSVEQLSISSDDYSVKNPSLSKDGKTLYFASDMPGGFGLFDIYKVAVNKDGSLGTPQNLGNGINTEGQEMFPYISDSNTLYYSSDGLPGLGGLDVFFTGMNNGSFAKVRNVGIPVNSGADDFAFTINEETESGFVSSNRMGGKGGDDIYAIKKIQPLCDVQLIATIVDSETGSPLSGATAILYNEKGEQIDSQTSDGSGKVNYTVTCEEATRIETSAEDYEGVETSVSGTSDEAASVKIMLDPVKKIIVADRILLNPIYFDYDKSFITSQGAFELDKLVQIMTNYPDMVISAKSHTDSRGNDSYNQRLSERRAKSTAAYVVSKGIDASRISGTGLGEAEPLFSCEDACTEEEHQLNRRSEFIIVSGGPNNN